MPLVDDGMRVGLGTGTTARWFILGLAERVRQGLTVRAVATSVASAALACDHCGESLHRRDERIVAGPGLEDPDLLPKPTKSRSRP